MVVGDVEILDPWQLSSKRDGISVSASGLLSLGLPGLSDGRGLGCLADAVHLGAIFAAQTLGDFLRLCSGSF